jgi:hypothetical protein
MVTFGEVRRLALSLPRTTEHLVYGRIKFRIKSIVYIGMSADERSMGFGFPKEERAALVAAEPEKFFMPIPSDERFNWVRVWLDAVDEDEMTELVVEAWRMCVPKRVAREHLGDPPDLRRAIEAAYVLRPAADPPTTARPPKSALPKTPPPSRTALPPVTTAPPGAGQADGIRSPGTPPAGRRGRSLPP